MTLISVVFSPSLGTQGFGVAAKSTQECRHADPTAVVAFHQTDIGEYRIAGKFGGH